MTSINFYFKGQSAPPTLVSAMQKHGGKSLAKSMQFFNVINANETLSAFQAIDFGTGEHRLTRDKKINKEGIKGWLPFASRNGDDFLAIDFNPGPDGNLGQVISFCFEDGRYKWLADSFDNYWKTTGLD